MRPTTARQLAITTSSRKISIHPRPGVEWEIELYPDETEALADRLREAAREARYSH
jgi:hypothetical protein